MSITAGVVANGSGRSIPVQVNAVAAAENPMVAEDRIARLESDVDEPKGDVKVLNARVSESIQSNRQGVWRPENGNAEGIWGTQD